MDLEKIAKKCQNLFRKIQNRENSSFHWKSDIFILMFVAMKLGVLDKNDLNTLFLVENWN